MCLDTSKLVDKHYIHELKNEVLIKYKSNSDSSVRVFLCKAGKNAGRITLVNENNIANIEELR